MIINSGEITTLILSGTAVLLDSEVENLQHSTSGCLTFGNNRKCKTYHIDTTIYKNKKTNSKLIQVIHFINILIYQ